MIELLPTLILSTGLDHRFLANQPGWLSLSISEGLAYLALLVALLQMIVADRSWRRHIVDRLTSIGAPIAIYAIWATAVSLANLVLVRDSSSLHALKDAVPGLILAGIVICTVDRPDRRRMLLDAVIAMIGLLGLLGILQHVAAVPYINPVDDNAYFKLAFLSQELVRRPIVGTLGHPNALAEFLVPLVLLSVGLMHRKEMTCGTARSVARFVGLGLACAGLILTQAKLAIGVLVAGAATLAVLKAIPIRHTRWSGVFVLVSLLTLGCAFVWALTSMGDNLPYVVDVSTLWERVVLNSYAFDVMHDTPRVVGIGGGLALFAESSPALLGVHNEYIKQVLEYGLPGAVLLSLLLLRCISPHREGGDWGCAVPAMALMLLFTVEAATGSQLQSMLFLVLSASATIGSDNHNPTAIAS